MASTEELYAALRNADAAGDTAGAQKLAAYIQSTQGDQAQAPAPEPKKGAGRAGVIQDPIQDIKDIGGGLIRGAGTIGSTLMRLTTDNIKDDNAGMHSGYAEAPKATPSADMITGGKPKPLSTYEQRNQGMDQGLTSAVGSNPDSGLYKVGKTGMEIAGTAGAGGATANGLAKLAQLANVSKYAEPLVEAVRTSGMSAGGAKGLAGLATRSAGGAISGGAQGLMIDPNDAWKGAAAGGIVPGLAALAKAGGTLGKKFIGGTTGVGDEALTQAYQAGKEGGKAAESFTSNMRGDASMDDVLAATKQNVNAMGQQKQAAYKQGMAGIKSDKTVLDMANISKSVDDALGMATYKGQVKNESAATALGKIRQEVDAWKNLDPAEYHTPEGLDALKQKIGGIVESIPFEQKTARSAAGNVYKSIKDEITHQAPEYAKVMKDYSTASDLIQEIERSLSIGPRGKASADTAMRKLQSVMRNNVNTNYGQRTALVQALEDAGGQKVMPALAGQSLSAAMPRGIQRALSGTGGAGLALTGNIPAAAGLAAISSPRLMGEAFYGAGKAVGAIDPRILQMLSQSAVKGAPVIAAQPRN